MSRAGAVSTSTRTDRSASSVGGEVRGRVCRDVLGDPSGSPSLVVAGTDAESSSARSWAEVVPVSSGDPPGGGVVDGEWVAVYGCDLRGPGSVRGFSFRLDDAFDRVEHLLAHVPVEGAHVEPDGHLGGQDVLGAGLARFSHPIGRTQIGVGGRACSLSDGLLSVTVLRGPETIFWSHTVWSNAEPYGQAYCEATFAFGTPEKGLCGGRMVTRSLSRCSVNLVSTL